MRNLALMWVLECIFNIVGYSIKEVKYPSSNHITKSAKRYQNEKR
jgi:hypothetical protein